jgi:hypothetical protein
VNPTWLITAPLTAVGIGYLAVCWAGRRRDREWAAGVARKVRERNAEIEMLKQLYAMESAEERR